MNQPDLFDEADARLTASLRKLANRRRDLSQAASAAKERKPASSSHSAPRDWQRFIESELNALNRRLTTIEARMTLTFYLVAILTVVTVIADASKAEALIRAVLHLP